MKMILICLLSLFAIASSQSQQQPVCVKLESVCESICPHHVERTALRSLRGPPRKVAQNGREGKQGRRGIKGEKGSAGEANYDRVEEMISQRIQEVLDKQSRKFSEISNLLTETNDKIRNIENRTDSCPINYEGKCFWIEYRNSRIAIEEARAICYAEGGRLADIYSEIHYYTLLRNLRMFGGNVGNAYAWVGMTYNAQTNTISLSDGTRAPFVKWRSGYPQSSRTSSMYLYARRNQESSNQHLANAFTTSSTVFGAICEK